MDSRDESNSELTGQSLSAGDELTAGYRVTWVGAAINVFLIVLKLWAGIAGRSQALVADGVHSLSDLFSDAVVIFGLRWGRKDADEDHHYGHARIETSASLIMGLLLLGVAAWIAGSAIHSFSSDRVGAPKLVVIFAAFASILLKEGLYWYTLAVGRRISSPVVIGNAWHHRSDALSSVAVLIGAGAAYLKPSWRVADAVAALVVALFILRVSVSLMRSAIKEMIDTAPDQDIMGEIERLALSVEGVRSVHDLKARYSGAEIFVELHIAVDPDITVRHGHAIADQVEVLLLERIKGVTRAITHVDPDE